MATKFVDIIFDVIMLKIGFIGSFLSLPRFLKNPHWKTEKDKIWKMQKKTDEKKNTQSSPFEDL